MASSSTRYVLHLKTNGAHVYLSMTSVNRLSFLQSLVGGSITSVPPSAYHGVPPPTSKGCKWVIYANDDGGAEMNPFLPPYLGNLVVCMINASGSTRGFTAKDRDILHSAFITHDEE